MNSDRSRRHRRRDLHARGVHQLRTRRQRKPVGFFSTLCWPGHACACSIGDPPCADTRVCRRRPARRPAHQGLLSYRDSRGLRRVFDDLASRETSATVVARHRLAHSPSQRSRPSGGTASSITRPATSTGQIQSVRLRTVPWADRITAALRPQLAARARHRDAVAHLVRRVEFPAGAQLDLSLLLRDRTRRE
jgi:hypothetical protein